MSLKLNLKPYERLIVGGAVIANGSHKTELFIENKALVLREKDIMTTQHADTHCKKLYLAIQLMYIDEKNLTEYYDVYWKLVRELINAAPRLISIIDSMNEHIISGRYYPALKLAKELIHFEEEALNGIKGSVVREQQYVGA
ncbi:MAG: flagellar biosynthesis repressor FlbT [Nitrospirae bacterium]|nr:flagellar biosynthesis repressor FlbT [Nitrospirota bacterium]